jgi:dTDP-4-dehydrorhamnose 3,5-epimerase
MIMVTGGAGFSGMVTITGGAHRIVWIPPGFAHGYVVLSEHAIVFYKAADYYVPEHERAVLWSDPALGLRWPLDGDPIVSDRDRRAPLGRTLRLKILLAGRHGQVGWRRRPGRSCGSAPKDRSTWFLRRCCPVRVRPCRRNENSIDVVEGRIF